MHPTALLQIIVGCFCWPTMGVAGTIPQNTARQIPKYPEPKDALRRICLRL